MFTTQEISIKLPSDVVDELSLYTEKGYSVIVKFNRGLGFYHLEHIKYLSKNVIELKRVVLLDVEYPENFEFLIR